jgi:uncharacterized cupin superfamily protein
VSSERTDDGDQDRQEPNTGETDALGVSDWPIWAKEASEFPWYYDQPETCYILDGHVIVTPDGGSPVEIAQGDLATFPQGMACTWKITRDIKKHYRFG